MSLSKEIINGDIDNLKRRLELGANACEYDPYGYNPLIMSIMTNSTEAFDALITYGADINQTDIYGNSALSWAIKCESLPFVQRLCKKKARVISSTLEQEPLLVTPTLRKKSKIIQQLQAYGCRLEPTEDYILQKSLGHIFELHGLGAYRNHVNVITLFQYQGFKIEFALNQIYYYWQLFKSDDHWITEVIYRATEVRNHKTLYRNKNEENISSYLDEYNFFPIAMEGHAISLCHNNRHLVVIDRSHGSHQPLEVYRLKRPLSHDLCKEILFKKKDRKFVKNLVHSISATFEYSYSIPRQVIGNCTWANQEIAPIALELLYNLENKNKMTQGQINDKFTQWSTWCKEFIYKSALLKAKTLEKDRQKLLTYTLTHIATHCEIHEDLISSLATLVKESNLEKYVKIILENYKQAQYIKNKVLKIEKVFQT